MAVCRMSYKEHPLRERELRLEPVEEGIEERALEQVISTERDTKYESSCGLCADDSNRSDHIVRISNQYFFDSYPVHYRICKDRPTNALSCMFLYFSRWLLHVSARQCHPQGATGFLLSYFKVQSGRRQVTEGMV
jgi:hypothetical protein